MKIQKLKKNEDSEGFEIFASGSYSFSKYLSATRDFCCAISSARKSHFKSTQMASLTSSLSIEISNLNAPALNNKSFKVPEESAVTRRRWRDPYIQSRNQD